MNVIKAMISTGRKIPVFRNAKLIPTARASILVVGTELSCSIARKKDVERNRHSFPLTKIVAVLLFIEEIYEKR